MPLNPQAEAWLNFVSESGLPPLNEMSVTDARATYRRLGRGVERYPAATAHDIASMSFTATGSLERPLALAVTATAERIVASLSG